MNVVLVGACLALFSQLTLVPCEAITERAIVTEKVYLDLEIEGEAAGREGTKCGG